MISVKDLIKEAEIDRPIPKELKLLLKLADIQLVEFTENFIGNIEESDMTIYSKNYYKAEMSRIIDLIGNEKTYSNIESLSNQFNFYLNEYKRLFGKDYEPLNK